MGQESLKLGKPEFFSLVLIILLQFVSIACANMLIPSYGVMVAYYNVDSSMAGIPDAVFVFVSAGFAVLWGYYTDKIDRNRVASIGAFLGSLGTLLTAFNTIQNSQGFYLLILSRAITGAGLGSIVPVVYSVLADVVPADKRSQSFGVLAIMSSISNGIGQGLSSFLGESANIFGMGFRFPFFAISIFSIGLIFLLFFVKLPNLGSTESDLESLKDFELEYIYQLSAKDITQILKKKTNLAMFIQGFLCIIPGTLIVYFLTSLFSSPENGLFKVLDPSIRLQTSSIMAALVGVGYIVGNWVLAIAGDHVFKKRRRNRVLLGAISLILAVPLSLGFILSAIPLNESINTLLSPDSGVFDVLIVIFQNYPQYVSFFIFAFFGSLFSAATVANRGAIIVDVNLPEHRGTTVSFFNLSEQLGKGLTLLLSWPLMTFFGNFMPGINPQKSMLLFAVMFFVPAAALWFYASRKVEKDLDDKSMILRERTQLTFIDYIFELEIKLDEGILMVHDAKHSLGVDNSFSMDRFNKAIKIFQSIETRAIRQRSEGLVDLVNHAHNLSLKAIVLKTELKAILKLEKSGEIKPNGVEFNQLRYKIDEWWERSDLGKIEVLNDSGILKVVESRLLRKYNLFKTLRGLTEAIEIFKRVEILARERLVDEGSKKLTDEEKTFQNRTKDLMSKATTVKLNTISLRERLDEYVSAINKEGVSSDELEKSISLAAEYKIPFLEILIEVAKKKKNKKIFGKISREIDDLFDSYDEQIE